MAHALILRAPGAIFNPGDNPVLSGELLFNYDETSLDLENGDQVAEWGSSGGSWPGDLIEATTPAPTFVAGTVPSVHFDGSALTSDSPISLPNSPITVASLVNIDDLEENRTIVSSSDEWMFLFLRVYSSGRFALGMSDGLLENRVNIQSNAVVPVGGWVFLCGVCDGQNSRVYVEEQRTDGALDVSPGVWRNVRLGAASSFGTPFKGRIAGAAAFGRALNHQEVLDLREEWLDARGLLSP